MSLEVRKRYIEGLKRLLESEGDKVAFHYNCTDGIISATLVRSTFEERELLFLPIDYTLLNDRKNPAMIKMIVENQWFAIVDLSPFNVRTAELYVDHHISNINKSFNARKVFFVAGAPSTAFLFKEHCNKTLPAFLQELARMTEITDTANYRINAPDEFNEEMMSYTWDEKIWLLEDACKTAFTIEEHQELIDLLSSEGWEGLWKENILERIKLLRYKRKRSNAIVKEAKIADLVIIIDKPDHYSLGYITHELLRNGATVGIYITIYPDYAKLSMRLAKRLSDGEIEFYRVDDLAKQMNGGGHKPAAGCQTETLEEALEVINKWAKSKKLTISTIDLRDRD